MIKVAVVGASGYTGIELIRLLVQHPQVELVSISSRTYAQKKLADYFRNFFGKTDLVFSEQVSTAAEVVFLATPHGVAMEQAQGFLDQGKKIIDLSADFRLADSAVWEQWYKQTHTAKPLLASAVYGLPEIHRKTIMSAQLVANPGCYATASLLGAYPLIRERVISGNSLIIDAKSGVSGAGRRADVGLLFAEIQDNFKAYKASGHRHFPEIQTQLQQMTGTDKMLQLSFTPHLLPIGRGILASLYFETELDQPAIHAAFEATYQAEPFVHVLGRGQNAEVRHVRASNDCHIAIHKPDKTSVAKVFVAIDNLMKGAAGQAVQNLNLVCGFVETEGLKTITALP